MKPELREKILKLNRERAADREKSEDMMTLLGALPPGQVKNLMKNETCAKILEKYGIGGTGA